MVLHQGPAPALRESADERRSEIAGRFTNLFRSPRPIEVAVGATKRFLEEGLIHRTERGELVRSKSELVIADKLHARGVPYVYEQQILLAGHPRHPDFTIVDDASGRTIYWEHLGLLADPGYARRWQEKLALYRAAGIRPHEDSGGPNGTLVTSEDDAKGGLDAAHIAELIERVVLA